MCEAEFAAYAMEVFLKRERRTRPLQQGDEGRFWKTERMVELATRTEDWNWQRPPLVGSDLTKDGDSQLTDYDFHLRPDCAYWLSLQAFNDDYVLHVHQHTFVIDHTITCPYLTIEFKRDGTEVQVAFNQVAAAAALALYNRYSLRNKSLYLAKRNWEKHHVSPLKHYGLTFTGAKYTVWCIRAQLTSEYQWNGCIMEEVYGGSCISATSVRDLFDWINEIHCWGLTEHGPGCQNDVKLSMRAGESASGIRVSDIMPAEPREGTES